MSHALPHRPRLADHALLRCHLVDGVEKHVLHDAIRHELLEIGARELDLCQCADGTRDFDGIVLEAVRRGRYRRASELYALLLQLHERGLLADGIAVELSPEAARAPRPIEPLPGYRFSCRAPGSCCTTYGSVPFSRDEAMRAQALVPDAPGPADAARRFLPLTGSVSRVRAVALVDGACPYLHDDGRCRVELAGGVEAKPRGCRLYPAVLVDDGEAVRCSVAVECACVLASLELYEGEPLLTAQTSAELPAELRVPRLPAEAPLDRSRSAPRAELRRWTAAVVERLIGHRDALAASWALAEVVSREGLAIAPALAAIDAAKPPPGAALGMHLLALAAKTRDKRDTADAWRAARDRTRRLAHWLDAAAQALLEPARAEALLSGPRAPAHEALYLRAILFGYGFANQLPVVDGLRDRAVRLLFARALAGAPAPDFADASIAYPLTAVEAMMRGQGLETYAREAGDGIVSSP